MAIVYVLKSREGLRYIGCTEDLARRIQEHNSPENRGWTRRGSSWEVIYTEEYGTLGEARVREKWMKSGVGRGYLKRILPRYS